MIDVLLIFNAGSSTIKLSVFDLKTKKKIIFGLVDRIKVQPLFKLFDAQKNLLHSALIDVLDYEKILDHVFEILLTTLKGSNLIIRTIGHRVVHGGSLFDTSVIINKKIINQLKELIPLAPLHQPFNLKIIEFIDEKLPGIPQVACFDTAFHSTQMVFQKIFAIPSHLTEKGIVRYGFHGLSYEYLVNNIDSLLEGRISINHLNHKIIFAHLGSGASMCGVINKQSVATTMGFSPLEGLMMGTRCGRLDPGVVFYLHDHMKYSIDEISKLLNSASGLLGVSELSADVRELEQASLGGNNKASFAIDMFCFRAAQELSALVTALGGLDMLVFTAGIGENSPLVRMKICSWLRYLGVDINKNANQNNFLMISSPESKVFVAVLPTDEEAMILHHATRLCC